MGWKSQDGGLIKKLSVLITRCRWKLNSLIGADFYTYAQIHIAPETLKMEVRWVWFGVRCRGLILGEPLKFGGLYIFTLMAQFLLDLGFSCLRLKTVRSERVFQKHLHPSPFISPLTLITCPRKVKMEWFSEAGLNPKLLCVILSLGFFLPSVTLLLSFAQPSPHPMGI